MHQPIAANANTIQPIQTPRLCSHDFVAIYAFLTGVALNDKGDFFEANYGNVNMSE
jgi:hypothetical protein